ncbi:3-oxo-5-alpha-steroid 4-dehydrogenase [Macleaya cordata]|uniref:3-oxo-5-alpha-steroid 4-dehydrogenase n=1 Tax=Macleaya cordata TaxID=56857 RepID=A0A200RB64_MACCD|nr:3-oxo-5-alpha-steroid 4-dehydrogenase [Macleaya cordata]
MGNFKNAVIAFLAPLPSIAFYLTFLHHYNTTITTTSSLNPLWLWCSNHPILLANVFFFFNVNLLFWVVGLIQSSHWMIDLYWTVIPVLLVHYYATHPFAFPNQWRSTVVILLTWVWSIRLTHNYFRRERWQWGAREDWRFFNMRKQYGKNWWWVSFFAVYVSQQAYQHNELTTSLTNMQVFLIGICLPMYAIHSVEKQWNMWDSLATLVCLSGIVIAYYADTQLNEFVTRNNTLKQLGSPTSLTLETGLWRYSRHPNYFGEQLWWWGLVLFGWNVGHGWTFLGSLINTLTLAYVTVLVERRMLKQEDRAKSYKMYQKTTSVWIPWFKLSPREATKDKNT